MGAMIGQRNHHSMSTDEQFKNWVESLHSEWFSEDGFFVKARDGVFDRARGEAVCSLLEAITLPEDGPTDRRLERRLVSSIYFIYTFLQWQAPAIEKKGGDIRAFVAMSERMRRAVMRILEYPGIPTQK